MRPSRVLLTVIWCLGIASALAAAAPPDRTLGESRAKKTLAYPIDAGRWRIVARVEFYGEGIPAGAIGDAMLRWWMRGVERHWNRDAVVEVPDAAGSATAVRLEFRVIWRRRAAGAAPHPDFHAVEVVRTVPELLARLAGRDGKLLDGYRSWVRYDAKTRTMSGCWANLAWPTVIAHEFGHIWGLGDEYDARSKGLARYFQGGPREWPPSLMDWSWLPLARPKPRHFRAIWENIERMGWKTTRPARVRWAI